MNFELLRVGIALAGVGFAAWQDQKTSYIDDRVLYAMIIAGALLDLATLDANFIYPTFLGFAFIMLLGYAAFRAGWFGAGDAYLLAGIHLLLPLPVALTQFAVPSYLLVLPPVATIFVTASLFATVGSAAFYARRLWGEHASVFKKPKAAFYFVVAFGLPVALLPLGLGALQWFAFSLFAESSLFFLVFKNEVSEKLIVKKVPLAKVEDEDLIATDKMPAALVKRLKIGKVATKEVMARLRRARVSSIWVHKSLPRFGPYIQAALLAALLTGDFAAFLLLS